MSGDNNKDPLFTNKLVGAGLVAALLIFGLPQLTAALTGGGHHGGGEELHLAYGGDIELETSAATEPENAPADLGALLADATVAGGERRSALCKSCHTFEEGGADGTGPNLYGVVGRQVASVAGFNYTGALKDFGGTWTYERLNAYIENSQAAVPGTGMTQRIGRDTQRADFLAFLGSLSANPVPFPAPVVVETEAAHSEDGAALEHAEEILEGAELSTIEVEDAAAKILNNTEDTVKNAANTVAGGVEEAAEDAVSSDGGE